MSSLPGLDLESYVMWQYDLVVDDRHGNTSVNMAVMLGTTEDHRLYLTKDQFAKVLAAFEPVREYVERRLDEFDEEQHGWRSYSSSIVIDDRIFNMAESYVKLYREMAKLDAELKVFDSIVEDIEVNTNRKKLSVTFKDNIQPDLELTAKGVDELIEKLTAIRPQLK